MDYDAILILALLIFIIGAGNVKFEIDNEKEYDRKRILGITTMKRVR